MPRSRRSDPSSKDFGAIVFRLRSERRWTLRDLGRFADMNPDYLGLLERGLNVPSLNTILILAEAFGVPAATIIAEVEAERPRRILPGPQ